MSSCEGDRSASASRLWNKFRARSFEFADFSFGEEKKFFLCFVRTKALVVLGKPVRFVRI